MWAKVDDHLDEHKKVFIAGARLGRQQTGRVLAVWLEGRLWTNRMNTQGFIPLDAVVGFRHDREPLKVAEALAGAITDDERRAWNIASVHCLWEKVEGGFLIHDDAEYRPKRATTDELREARREAGRRGGVRSGAVRSSQGSNGASDLASISKHNLKQTRKQSCFDLASETQAKTKQKTNPVSRYPDPYTGRTSHSQLNRSPGNKELAPSAKPTISGEILRFRRWRSRGSDAAGRPKLSTMVRLACDVLRSHETDDAGEQAALLKDACAAVNLVYDSASVGLAVDRALGRLRRRA